jgi:hypothetical protein
MLPPLLATFGMVGLIAGLFGLYLARQLVVNGAPEDAAETSHNASLLMATGTTMVLFGMLFG